MGKSKLFKDGIMEKVMEWHNEGKSLKEITVLLEYNCKIKVTPMTVKNSIDKYKQLYIKVEKQPEAAEEPEIIEESKLTAQEILYENRNEVIKMYKSFAFKTEIADRFGVEVADVQEFLSKRKKINPNQYKGIICKYAQGKTFEEIADEYEVHRDTIEKIIKKSVGNSPVIARVVKKAEEEKVEQEPSFEEDKYSLNVVKDFIKFIKGIEGKYYYYLEEIEKLTNTRNDIYHKLEIMDADESEQLKILEQIKQSSIDRREHKDFCDLAQPIIVFLEDNNNKKVISTLCSIAGEMVNKAKSMESRVYFLRESE